MKISSYRNSIRLLGSLAVTILGLYHEEKLIWIFGISTFVVWFTWALINSVFDARNSLWSHIIFLFDFSVLSFWYFITDTIHSVTILIFPALIASATVKNLGKQKELILFASLSVSMILPTACYIGLIEQYSIFGSPNPIQKVELLLSLILITMMSVHTYIYVDHFRKRLEAEQQRSDSLLKNILPDSIAERLKHYPKEPIAEGFESITVLFADIVNFTKFSTFRTTPDDFK